MMTEQLSHHKEQRLPQSLVEIMTRNKRLWDSKEDESFETELQKWIQEIKERLTALKGNSETQPHVTVVVPAKDEEKEILQLLDSLSKQKYKKGLEVLVVANNCKDRTAELAQSCGAEVVEYGSTEYGPIAFARQQGLKSAHGEIIISTDADALVEPNYVELITKPLDKDTAITCVTGEIKHWSLSGKNYRNADKVLSLFRRFLASQKNPAVSVGGNMAFRKSDAVEAGGYEIRIHPGEDVALSQALARKGKVKLDTSDSSAVWVSARRIEGSGGLLKTLLSRFKPGAGYTGKSGQQDFR